MSNEKRTEEVTEVEKRIVIRASIRGVLQFLPEFQSPPKSEWVECSERMPRVNQWVLVGVHDTIGMSEWTGNRWKNMCRGDEYLAADFYKRWMPIPTCVQPESPLVREIRRLAEADQDKTVSDMIVFYAKKAEKNIAGL